LFAERLTTLSIKDYVGKWDRLKTQVDEALESLKEPGTESVEANREALRAWFVEILHEMDLVERRRNPRWQLEIPNHLW